MNEGKSYVEPWKLGGNPEGGVVVRVIKSKNNKFREGDMLQGYLPWKMFQVGCLDICSELIYKLMIFEDCRFQECKRVCGHSKGLS